MISVLYQLLDNSNARDIDNGLYYAKCVFLVKGIFIMSLLYDPFYSLELCVLRNRKQRYILKKENVSVQFVVKMLVVYDISGNSLYGFKILTILIRLVFITIIPQDQCWVGILSANTDCVNSWFFKKAIHKIYFDFNWFDSFCREM